MKTGQQPESEILSDGAGFPVLRTRSTHGDESSDRLQASTITLEPVIRPQIDPVRVGSTHPDRPTHAINGVTRRRKYDSRRQFIWSMAGVPVERWAFAGSAAGCFGQQINCSSRRGAEKTSVLVPAKAPIR